MQFIKAIFLRIDTVNLLLGAILGTVLSYLVPVLFKLMRHIRYQHLSRNRQLATGKAVYEWLVRYYERRGHLDDLFSCSLGEFTDRIPMLTSKDWQYTKEITLEEERFIVHDFGVEKHFTVDKRLIAQRELLGQKLFDDPTLYLDSLDQISHTLRFHVRSCRYFEVATALIKLEEETFNAVRKRTKYRNLPIRDEFFGSREQASKFALKPYSIGCACVLAFQKGDSYEFLIQTRSSETITAGNMQAGIPQFGLVPLPRDDVKIGILTYNFVKEFCEELYNKEELDQLMTSRRTASFWLNTLPQACELLAMLQNGVVRLFYLGFGIDALSGTSTIALLGVVKESAFSESLRSNIQANWEVAKREFVGKVVEPLRFIDYHSSEMEKSFRNGELYYGSAFTISLATKYLNENVVFKGS